MGKNILYNFLPIRALEELLWAIGIVNKEKKMNSRFNHDKPPLNKMCLVCKGEFEKTVQSLIAEQVSAFDFPKLHSTIVVIWVSRLTDFVFKLQLAHTHLRLVLRLHLKGYQTESLRLRIKNTIAHRVRMVQAYRRQ